MKKNFLYALLAWGLLWGACSSSDSTDPTCLVVDGVKTQCDCCAIPDVLSFSSSDFDSGGAIPLNAACSEADVGGGNQLSKLDWTLDDSPDDSTSEEILSYAIIVEDTTENSSGDIEVPSPSVTDAGFLHMILFNIPITASTTENLSAEAIFAMNDNGEAAYLGPCPPPGSSAHEYSFTLHALGVQDLTSIIGSSRDTQTVYSAIIAQEVSNTSFTGTFTHP